MGDDGGRAAAGRRLLALRGQPRALNGQIDAGARDDRARAGTVGAGATSAPDGPQVRGSEPTDEDIGLAVAPIGFLLFGGGAAAAGRVEATHRDGTVTGEIPAATEEPPTEPAPDPCDEQAAEVEKASLKGRYVNHLLAQSRAYEAILQAEIDRLANVVLRGASSSISGLPRAASRGGASRAVIATTGWKKFAEGVERTSSSRSQSRLSEAIPRSARLRTRLASAPARQRSSSPRAVGRQPPVLRRMQPDPGSGRPRPRPNGLQRLPQHAGGDGANVAEPIASAIRSMLDLYSGAVDGITLKRKLDQLRATRDRILDMQAEMEIELEDAIRGAAVCGPRATRPLPRDQRSRLEARMTRRRLTLGRLWISSRLSAHGRRVVDPWRRCVASWRVAAHGEAEPSPTAIGAHRDPGRVGRSLSCSRVGGACDGLHPGCALLRGQLRVRGSLADRRPRRPNRCVRRGTVRHLGLGG